MLTRVIVAIDKKKLERHVHSLISQHDVMVETINKKSHLLERVSRESSDLIIISQSLIPEPVFDTINLFQQLPDAPGVIIISERKDPEEQAQFIAAGCDAVVHAGLSDARLQKVITALIAKRSALQQKTLSAVRPLAQPRLTDFVSASPAMQTFMNIVRRVAASDVPLLILGETGVGKERLARAIHAESARSKGPFITVNCGALPDTLLESELYGHEEGAFTGAIRSRRGWFELAHRGTIFLDEIGELPNQLQVKLLHVLQEHEIQRVGSEKSFKVDVRVMAATNRDLEKEVQSQYFRKDLFYRLSVMALKIPPLRDRCEDIPVLVESYIHYLRPRIGREIYSITQEALDALCAYAWPGNVRELINVIERAMLLCNGATITLEDMPTAISNIDEPAQPHPMSLAFSRDGGNLPEVWLQKPLHQARREMLEWFERSYLMGLLQLNSGRVGKTAKKAGIQPRSLFDKMRRLGLRKEDFRSKAAGGTGD